MATTKWNRGSANSLLLNDGTEIVKVEEFDTNGYLIQFEGKTFATYTVKQGDRVKEWRGRNTSVIKYSENIYIEVANRRLEACLKFLANNPQFVIEACVNADPYRTTSTLKIVAV